MEFLNSISVHILLQWLMIGLSSIGFVVIIGQLYAILRRINLFMRISNRPLRPLKRRY